MGDDWAEITLAQGGRVIRVDSIAQVLTYGGMMEGPPTAEWNKRHIERMQRNAAHQGDSFHLVSPVERPVNWATPVPGHDPYMELPAVQVRAMFKSRDPIDPSSDATGSTLTVVWFQNDWAFPIADDVVEHLRHVDWNSEATDYQW